MQTEGYTKRQKSYPFQTQQEAWQFVRQIYQFCGQSNQLRRLGGHHVSHCEGCGIVFEATANPFCDPCLAEEENIFKRFCEGVYHRTGSSQEALSRLAGMIKEKKTGEEKAIQKAHHQKVMNQAIQHNRYGERSTFRVSSDYNHNENRYR